MKSSRQIKGLIYDALEKEEKRQELDVGYSVMHNTPTASFFLRNLLCRFIFSSILQIQEKKIQWQGREQSENGVPDLYSSEEDEIIRKWSMSIDFYERSCHRWLVIKPCNALVVCFQRRRSHCAFYWKHTRSFKLTCCIFCSGSPFWNAFLK